MSDFVRYDITERVAVLTIDNPPVNALAPGVWDAIDEAVARGVADPAVDALVLIGAGPTFIAGADINIFKTLKTRQQSLERSGRTHALLRRLGDVGKPLVAAISPRTTCPAPTRTTGASAATATSSSAGEVTASSRVIRIAHA